MCHRKRNKFKFGPLLFSVTRTLRLPHEGFRVGAPGSLTGGQRLHEPPKLGPTYWNVSRWSTTGTSVVLGFPIDLHPPLIPWSVTGWPRCVQKTWPDRCVQRDYHGPLSTKERWQFLPVRRWHVWTRLCKGYTSFVHLPIGQRISQNCPNPEQNWNLGPYKVS